MNKGWLPAPYFSSLLGLVYAYIKKAVHLQPLAKPNNKSQYKKNNSKKKCHYFNIIIIIIFCFVESNTGLEGDKIFHEQFTIYSLQSGSFKIK